MEIKRVEKEVEYEMKLSERELMIIKSCVGNKKLDELKRETGEPTYTMQFTIYDKINKILKER